MINLYLLDISQRYFNEINVGPRPWNFMFFYFNQFIPEKRLKNAIKQYAHNAIEEKPIILMDDTFFNSGKRGFLLTNYSIYYNLFPTGGKGSNVIGNYKINDIVSFYINSRAVGSDILLNSQIIGTLSSFTQGKYAQKEAQILNDLFILLIRAILDRK